MAQTISISEAKNQFSEYISRAASSHESFLIERRGRPLAALVSAEDLKLLERMKEKGPEAGLLGAVGTWPEFESEVASHVRTASAHRDDDLGRALDMDVANHE